MTTQPPDNDDLDAIELTRLADGTLDPERAAELREQIASDPELAERLREQERGLELTRAAGEGVSAPARLRGEIERMQDGRTRRRRAPSLRVAGLVGAAGVAGAIVLALVLIPGGSDLTPSIVEVAEASEEPQPDPAPSSDPNTPALLEEDVEGVPFPRYVERFGWVATMSGTEEVDGRSVTTVVYEKDGQEISYSIVEGDPLTVPNDVQTVDVGDIEVEVLPEGIVTWEREGHTCVLVGDGVSEDELTELAGWTGMGAVPF